MASFDKLPSGKWQASVVLPVKTASGRSRRTTKTHALKRVVVEWATTLEASIAAGTWNQAERLDLTLREYREGWKASRISDSATMKKNESHWRNHIEPVWAGHPLALITRPELKTWIHRMHTQQCARCRAYPGLSQAGRLLGHKNPAGNACSGSGAAPGLGAWTIQGAVAHLTGLLSSAVEDGALAANPAVRLDLPTARPKQIFYWTRDEADRLLLELADPIALAVDLDLHIGLRPGELFGMRKHFVDTSAWVIHVSGVATRDGWRAHAKTSKSHRAVPVPFHLRDRFLEHLIGLGPDDLVFAAPDGGTWDDRNFAQRVFLPAVKRAGIREGSPYDMRHTAASWLVQAGVPLYDVQHLLGHEKFSTTQRYAHLQPGEFNAVLSAWGRGAPDPRSQAPSPSRPHEPSDRH